MGVTYDMAPLTRISRIDKFIGVESRLAVANGWRKRLRIGVEEWEVTPNWFKFLWGRGGNEMI